MSSEIKVNKITSSSGSTLEFGGAGDTVSVGSGATVSGFGGGKLLQVVQTYKTDTASTTSTSFTDVSGFSANITPASTSNKILVLVTIGGMGENAVSQAFFRLNRNGSVVGVGDAVGNRKQISGASIYISNNNSMASTAFNYLDSPSTTSSLTYKIQFSANAGTVFVNRSHTDSDATTTSRGTSSITLMEIAG